MREEKKIKRFTYFHRASNYFNNGSNFLSISFRFLSLHSKRNIEKWTVRKVYFAAYHNKPIDYEKILDISIEQSS